MTSNSVVITEIPGRQVSFQFTDVERPSPDKLKFTETTFSDTLRRDTKFFQSAGGIASPHSPPAHKVPFNHGVLGTIYQAYSQHIPLVLRPDDLWLSIAVAFGHYVERHAEEMRSCFVDHGGRKQLVVRVDSPPLAYTTPEHWDDFIALMSEQIDRNVTGDTVAWITPNFTTTTSLDRTVARVVLMGALKEYFEYKFELLCGLSQVTLEGTLDDWIQLVDKARGLSRFNQPTLTEWSELLVPVLEQFVESYRGNVDPNFWQRICTSESRGSGSQQTLCGWVLVFSPFDEHGKYVLNPQETVNATGVYGCLRDDSIPDCKISVPVVIDDHGTEYHAKFVAGSLTGVYDRTEGQLKPGVGWGIVTAKTVGYNDMCMRMLQLKQQYSQQSTNIRAFLVDTDNTKRLGCLLKFAYYAAQQYLFPNDSLTDLTDAVFNYYVPGLHLGRRRVDPVKVTENQILFGDFLHTIGTTVCGEGRSFQSYVNRDRINEIVLGGTAVPP